MRFQERLHISKHQYARDRARPNLPKIIKLGRSVMIKGNSGNRFWTEVGARAVRLGLAPENEADCRTWSECFRSVLKKIGCNPDTLQDWVNKQSIETGHREGLTLSERTQMKELQRGNGPRPPTEEMIMFVDDHGDHLGVEVI